VPAERVAALRKAFLDTLRDPELRAEGEKLHLDLDPISGEELQSIAAKMYATTPDVVERARQAVAVKAP
jgi:tripartite-type tricarboxylate transporter receptor subunit TctC